MGCVHWFVDGSRARGVHHAFVVCLCGLPGHQRGYLSKSMQKKQQLAVPAVIKCGVCLREFTTMRGLRVHEKCHRVRDPTRGPGKGAHRDPYGAGAGDAPAPGDVVGAGAGEDAHGYIGDEHGERVGHAGDGDGQDDGDDYRYGEGQGDGYGGYEPGVGDEGGFGGDEEMAEEALERRLERNLQRQEAALLSRGLGSPKVVSGVKKSKKIDVGALMSQAADGAVVFSYVCNCTELCASCVLDCVVGVEFERPWVRGLVCGAVGGCRCPAQHCKWRLRGTRFLREHVERLHPKLLEPLDAGLSRFEAEQFGEVYARVGDSIVYEYSTSAAPTS